MNIHLVTASHFSVPGVIKGAFSNEHSAKTEAARLTNIMLADTDTDDRPEPATTETWPEVILWLQEYHGAQFCYVDLDVLEVK